MFSHLSPHGPGSIPKRGCIEIQTLDFYVRRNPRDVMAASSIIFIIEHWQDIQEIFYLFNIGKVKRKQLEMKEILLTHYKKI